MTRSGRWFLPLGLAAGLILGSSALAPRPALAHCDGLDGPVVMAARLALEKSDVTRVLIWVQAK
ncbi:MAG TPA: DUF6448 family protein, partial [Candidatus Eisenbacteria bacterium]|nr:DUF6448 family protein [Candidatus Eisenbacteria bacterium]